MKKFIKYFIYISIIFTIPRNIQGQSDTTDYMYFYSDTIDGYSSNSVLKAIRSDTCYFGKNHFDVLIFTFGPPTNTVQISVNDSILTLREFEFNNALNVLKKVSEHIIYIKNAKKYLTQLKGYFQAWTNNETTDLYGKEIEVFRNSNLYSQIFIMRTYTNKNSKLPRFKAIKSLVEFFEELNI